jgi:hypothetical protein
MAGERSRSVRIYLRRQKAQLRREQGARAEAAIEALERQFPRPGAAGDRGGREERRR